MGIKEKLEEMVRLSGGAASVPSPSPPTAGAQDAAACSTSLSPTQKQTLEELRARISAITGGSSTPGTGTTAAPRRYIPTPQLPPHSSSSPSRAKGSPAAVRHNGREVRNAKGSFFLVEEALDGNHPHGDFSIGDFSEICTATLAMLADQKEIGALRCADALFLDLETTGLAGGTGTFPFMIGMGWLEDGKFVLQQLFSRDHSEERACLAHLLDAAERRGFLVTFNGKAYDVNLLSTRLVLNRFAGSLEEMPHLDLLHSCRRVFKHRLENCSLASVESGVLGYRRSHDIPGMEIPQRYFDWLRRRDPALVSDIFYHNRLDIISLAGIALSLSRLTTAAAGSPERDSLNMERLKIQRSPGGRDLEKLLTLADSSDTSVALEALEALSLVYKRDGALEKAEGVWKRMLSLAPNSFFAAEELAKHYEHREHKYFKALDILEDFVQAAGFIPREQREVIERRQERLQRKLREENPGC